MVLLTRDTYQRLLSEQEEQETPSEKTPVTPTPMIPMMTTAVTPASLTVTERSEEDPQSMTAEGGNNAENLKKLGINSDILLHVSDRLLKNISSAKTTGKLMALWLFLKNKIESNDLRVNDNLEMMSTDGKWLKG